MKYAKCASMISFPGNGGRWLTGPLIASLDLAVRHARGDSSQTWNSVGYQSIYPVPGPPSGIWYPIFLTLFRGGIAWISPDEVVKRVTFGEVPYYNTDH